MTTDLRAHADEFASLFGARPLPRRGFVAGGFAAAVAPTGALRAQTIITDEAGLVSEEVLITTADGRRMPAWRAQPVGRQALATVLVVHEAFGVHEHIRDVCRRFAKAGWQAIAPDLFFRQGDPRRHETIAEIFAQVISRVPDAQVLSDLDAAAQWAAGNGGSRERLGITGFCWGGRIVWLYAAHRPGLKAGIAWYGRLSGTSNALTPQHPLDVAETLRAPVLGLYGGRDEGIPLSVVEEMKLRLSFGRGASQISEFVVYPDAPHAFHADYRPSFRAEAAADAWTRCLAWLRRFGASA
jgi:carboxymethylenebutenolidase